MTESLNVLFVGLKKTPLCWYRCALPARALGADWAGVAGEPTALEFLTGHAGRPLRGLEDFKTYDIVVLQQVHGKPWLQAIRELRAAGVTVL